MGVLCDLTMNYRWNNIFHVMHKAKKCSFKGRDWWSPDARAVGEMLFQKRRRRNLGSDDC